MLEAPLHVLPRDGAAGAALGARESCRRRQTQLPPAPPPAETPSYREIIHNAKGPRGLFQLQYF